MIVEFLGNFTKTVRLNWKLWLVSIAIAIIRWEVFLDLDLKKKKKTKSVKTNIDSDLSTLKLSTHCATSLFFFFYGHFCFPPFSWPLAVLGKLIPVPSTPFANYFSRCCFWRKKQGTSSIPNRMQILGSPWTWLKFDLGNRWPFLFKIKIKNQLLRSS